MFAPNRLLTPKEQWLLLGVAVAVLVGSITLVYHNTRDSGDPDLPDLPVHGEFNPSPGTDGRQTAPEPILNISDRAALSDKAADDEHVASNPQPEIIGVAVMGAVQRPGLYLAPEGLRLSELINLAGGVTETADLSDIRLTALAIDETTLTIPELRVMERGESHLVARRGSAAVVNHPHYRKQPTAPPVFHAPPPAPAAEAGADATGLLNINTATSEQLQQLPGIGAVYAARIIAERERRPFASVDELTRVSGIGEKRLESLRPHVTAP